MHTDPIADLLTRIRNASAARHRTVDIPGSKVKLGITKVLYDMGYILGYKFIEDEKQGTIKIALKYDRMTKDPAFVRLERVSKPGLRKYANVSEMPEVANGLGVSIISTSKGILTGKQAKSLNVGGEVLCYVF